MAVKLHSFDTTAVSMYVMGFNCTWVYFLIGVYRSYLQTRNIQINETQGISDTNISSEKGKLEPCHRSEGHNTGRNQASDSKPGIIGSCLKMR